MTANRTCKYHRSHLPSERAGSGLRRGLLQRFNIVTATSGSANRHKIPGMQWVANGLFKARSLCCFSIIALMALTTYRSSAQVMPTFRLPVRISAFTTFTAAKPHLDYYDDLAVWGFTAGGIAQLPRFGGVEVRGSMLRYGGLSHQESLLAGPRVAVHILHTTPYAALLVGEGNSWWWSNPPGKHLPPRRLEESNGFQWALVGGLDVHLHNRISVRVGEVSYNRLYTPLRNLTPITASAGLVFRIN
jgi:hypothetical protein